MKKLLTLLVFCIPFMMNAQLSNENFDGLATGSFDTQWDAAQWVGWFGAASSTTISDVQANSAPNSLLLDSADDDVVALLGTLNGGTYEIIFHQYIPAANGAYYNLQHNYTNTAGDWAADLFFGDMASDTATITTDGVATAFTPIHDAWVENKFVYDFEAEQAEFYYNGTLIHTWVSSTNVTGGPGLNQLNGINFYGSCLGANCVTTSYYDDVSVVQTVAPPPVDVALLSVKTPMEYTNIPTGLAVPMVLEGEVMNDGTVDITNVELSFMVKDGTGTVVHSTTSSPIASLAAGASQVVTGMASYTPIIDDTYTVEYTVTIAETETEVDNNETTFTSDLVFTDSTFARDDGVYTDGISAGTAGTQIGQNFEFTDNATISSVSSSYAGGLAGDIIRIHIYNVDAGGKPTNLLATTPDYALPADGGGLGFETYINLPIINGLDLTPGTYSFVLEQVAVNNIVISTSPNIFTPGTIPASLDGGATWDFIEDLGAFAFALNIRPEVGEPILSSLNGVNYVNQMGLSPNPTNGAFTIDLALNKAMDVQIDVFNTQGQLIRTLNKSNLSVDKINIDLSKQATGLYLIRTTIGEQVITKRLTVTK